MAWPKLLMLGLEPSVTVETKGHQAPGAIEGEFFLCSITRVCRLSVDCHTGGSLSPTGHLPSGLSVISLPFLGVFTVC